jgi:hypothetical protein
VLGFVGEPFMTHHVFEPLLEKMDITLSAGLLRTISLISGVTLITIIHMVIGEQVPKTMGIRFSLETALLVAWPLRIFNAIFAPFVWLINKLTRLVLRIFGIQMTAEHEEIHSEEELRLILTESEEGGAIKQSDRNGHLARIGWSVGLPGRTGATPQRSVRSCRCANGLADDDRHGPSQRHPRRLRVSRARDRSRRNLFDARGGAAGFHYYSHPAFRGRSNDGPRHQGQSRDRTAEGGGRFAHRVGPRRLGPTYKHYCSITSLDFLSASSSIFVS